MMFEERTYSALVVSSSDKLNRSLSPFLTGAHCEPVQVAGNLSTAKRLLAERQFDFVILNMLAPNDAGLKFSVDVSAAAGTVCLVLTKADYYADIRAKVVPHGVFTLSVPSSPALIGSGMEFLSSARERLRYFEKKTVSIQDKMDEIRLVNRAKWLLIENRNMTEPDAHRYIEKQAMDTRATRREVANDIIGTYG